MPVGLTSTVDHLVLPFSGVLLLDHGPGALLLTPVDEIPYFWACTCGANCELTMVLENYLEIKDNAIITYSSNVASRHDRTCALS